MQRSFYSWLVYMVLGLALINFIPDKYKMMVIVIIILGGAVYIDKNGGGINRLLAQLQGANTSAFTPPAEIIVPV